MTGRILHASKRFGAAALALLVLFAFACGDQDHDPGQITLPDIGFASQQKLVDHYRKHGPEFGAITMEQYLRKAQALRDRQGGETILEDVRPDGVVTRFDRASGDFIAFNENGVIRTYFRPDDGEAYYRRQLRRMR